MLNKAATSFGLAFCLAAAAAPNAIAQDATGAIPSEAAFLQSLEGRFSGAGTFTRLRDGGEGRRLTCNLTSDSQGNRLTLDGKCTAAVVFGTSVRVDVRYDPASKRYSGSFRDGLGTVANLSGTRRGQTIQLAFNETAESVRPGPPATLTIAENNDRLSLSLQSTRSDAGQNLRLSLQKQ